MRIKFKPTYQHKMFIEIKKKEGLSERKLASLLKVKRSTLSKWIREINLLPVDIFEKIIYNFPYTAKYKKYIEEKLDDDWGRRKGGIHRISKLSKEELDRLLEKIRKKRKYKRLVKKVKDFKLFNIYKKYKSYLLAIMLITDGCVSDNIIEFTSKDKTLRDFYVYLCRLNGVKKIFCRKANDIYRIYFFDKTTIKKLKRISPSYKTSPSRNQKINEYFKEPQPTLKKFFKLPKKIIKECIRIAMSCDGNISIRILTHSTKIKLRPELTLNCAHPFLVKEWKKLFKIVGIKMKIQKNKCVWGGIRGISTEKIEEIEKFYKLGGFINKVKISKKSKRLGGVEKNKVLAKCLKIKYLKNLKEFKNLMLGP